MRAVRVYKGPLYLLLPQHIHHCSQLTHDLVNLHQMAPKVNIISHFPYEKHLTTFHRLATTNLLFTALLKALLRVVLVVLARLVRQKARYRAVLEILVPLEAVKAHYGEDVEVSLS